MSLYDWLQAGGGVALLLMTLVQIAPIKINPWSAVARGIGKTMNKDMMDKLESVETEVKDLKEKHDKLENRMDKDDADACRTRILRFADELRRGVEHSEEFLIRFWMTFQIMSITVWNIRITRTTRQEMPSRR